MMMKKRRDKKINDKDVYNIYEYRTRQDTRRVSAHSADAMGRQRGNALETRKTKVQPKRDETK